MKKLEKEVKAQVDLESEMSKAFIKAAEAGKKYAENLRDNHVDKLQAMGGVKMEETYNPFFHEEPFFHRDLAHRSHLWEMTKPKIAFPQGKIIITSTPGKDV